MNRNKNRRVTASEIGAARYCAYKMYLDEKYGKSRHEIDRFDAGNNMHREFNAARSRINNKTIVIFVMFLLAAFAWVYLYA